MRFGVLVDGDAPGRSRGVDVDEDGIGGLREGRMYQLVHQHHAVRHVTRCSQIEEVEIDATDDRGRRWYRLRPKTPRGADSMGSNSTPVSRTRTRAVRRLARVRTAVEQANHGQRNFGARSTR